MACESVDALLGPDWAFVCSQAGYLGGGLVLTVALTVTSLALGLLAGFPAGVIEAYGGRYSRAAVGAVGVLLRGTPLLVILVFAYFAFPVTAFVPEVTAFGFEFGDAFAAATLGLGLRSAAYQSQIFRGALQSVGGGQLEAARAVGMTRLQGVRHVVVPQALRRSIPGFQNELTIVLKDTSVAFAIGLSELLTRSYDLFVQRTTAVLEIVLFVSLVYFVLTFTANRAIERLGDAFAVPGEGASG